MNNSLRLTNRVFLTLVLVTFLASCTYHHRKMVYYKGSNNPAKVNKVMSKVSGSYNTYLYVLHVGDTLWKLTNVSYSGEEIKGQIGKLDSDSKYFYESIDRRPNKRVRVTKYTVGETYQAHLYVTEIASTGNEVSFAKDQIQKIDLYNMDRGTTALSYVGTATLSTFGGLAALLAIACTLCPHVYVINSDTYQFANGLFVGAIAEQLERDDYKVLPDIDPGSDIVKMIIKNEEDEVQKTNLLELAVVEHSKDQRLVPDQNGGFSLFSKTIDPATAINDENNDVSIHLNVQDENFYDFASLGENNLSNLYLTYPANELTGNSSLILTVSNHGWGGYVYDEFSSMFGAYYDNWVKKNGKKTREEMLADIEKQGIPITVAVKTTEGWEQIETINLVGSRILNSIAVPINKKYLGQSEIQIRLSTGFMFWKIDEAVIATGVDPDPNVQYIKPELKVGKSAWETSLSADDDDYMVHQEGDSVLLQFSGLPVTEGKSRTLVIHGKGYYLKHNEYKGIPQVRTLKSLNINGGLSLLSFSMYKDLTEHLFVDKL